MIVLFPSALLLPVGWADYDAAGHAPSWWDPPVSVKRSPASSPAQSAVSRRKRPSAGLAEDASALFGIRELAEASHADLPASDKPSALASLGTRIVASSRMADQRQFARRAPDNARVAALIDGIAQAGGRVTVAEAAHIAGESAVRMSGYIAQVARLLNVDGYRVIGTTDGGRTVELNTQLLRQQFLSDSS